METYQPPSGPRQFIGVLRQGYSGQAIISVTGWNAFTATDADLVNDGLRLTSIQSYPVGWSRQYIGVYGWGNDGSALASVNGYGRLVPMDETLARANALPLGLAAYAFTGSEAVAQRLQRELRAGMLAINHGVIATPEVPFGGVGDSGMGREGGIEGVQAFLQARYVSRGFLPTSDD